MELSEAATSHLRNFSEFHVGLNKYVKLSVAALDNLSKSNENPAELSGIISDLIKDAGERWMPTIYVQPHDEIVNLKFQLTESAIMWVFSSFEVFLGGITGAYDEYSKKNKEEIDSQEYGATVLRLFEEFGWTTGKIKYLLPVYHFYNIARHCVVHRMGRANKELIDLSASSDFLSAIHNWPTVIPGGKLSPPPTVKENNKIDLRPHHAITYSDVCYRLAREINENLIEMLGLKYFVIRAVTEKILRAESLESPPGKDLYYYLRRILLDTYNIKGVKFPEIRKILDEAGIREKCYTKHALMLQKIPKKEKHRKKSQVVEFINR